MDRQPEVIRSMFNGIAEDYDRLNHLLSLGIDKSWRRRALKEIVEPSDIQNILDVACGTGDFSIAIASKANPETKVKGIDLSEGMLAVMSEKISSLNLERMISTQQGNCESMPFSDCSFDRVSIAFGIRNFEHREKALEEILRVLRPGGKLVILELSVPSNRFLKALYSLYFKNILPLVGGFVSGKKAAYSYLPASVIRFPGKDEWIRTMSSCGYSDVRHTSFTFGICRMYSATK